MGLHLFSCSSIFFWHAAFSLCWSLSTWFSFSLTKSFSITRMVSVYVLSVPLSISLSLSLSSIYLSSLTLTWNGVDLIFPAEINESHSSKTDRFPWRVRIFFFQEFFFPFDLFDWDWDDGRVFAFAFSSLNFHWHSLFLLLMVFPCFLGISIAVGVPLWVICMPSPIILGHKMDLPFCFRLSIQSVCFTVTVWRRSCRSFQSGRVCLVIHKRRRVLVKWSWSDDWMTQIIKIQWITNLVSLKSVEFH